MSKLLIKNIGILAGTQLGTSPLRGTQLAELPQLTNAWLLVDDDRIAGFGPMGKCPDETLHATEDAGGRIVLPGWCDSHTHIVFPATREMEFVEKIKGSSYEEIAGRGGGILNSVNRLRDMPEDELYQLSLDRLQTVIRLGTTSIEIKSGYGLTTDAELKMLRVIRRLQQTTGMHLRSSFLGAHTFPTEYRGNHQGYINLIIEKMLPAIAKDGLADYIDVFCENGFFSPAETEQVLRAGIEFGLKPKIHANQLHASGGVETGIKCGAVSVDHLETMNESSIAALAHSTTIGTMLPSAAFFLRMPYQPARQMIDQNCALSLATDYNPGSSPSGNMNFVVSLACIQMKMLPEEAINAATVNGACAMELQHEVGSIHIGKKANLIVTSNAASLAFLPYDFGNNHIYKVMLNGKWVK